MFARKMFDLPGFGWGSPLSELERMRRQMDTLSDMLFRSTPSRFRTSAGVFPMINLTEDQGNYYLRAELPGLKAEDLDIQVVGRNVTVSGERKIPAEGDGVNYHRREREAGKFSRAVGLPGDIDPEKVAAKIVNGILAVTIPKAETAKPRQIAIS